jgi:uracil-DNA glycosylase family 4
VNLVITRRNSCSARPRWCRGATTISTIRNKASEKTASGNPLPAVFCGEPDRDCPLCPRLLSFREAARAREPGLAPGLQGANRTGRPFTGDFAGDLLYATLIEYGFAEGIYQARPDDGLKLIDCRISNAVRCVPPQNKPLPVEISTCRQFLTASLASMPRLSAIVALGRVAHDSTLKALNVRSVEAPFAHGAIHRAGAYRLYDSYHCSRYNTNTRVLTPEMFRSVFARVRADLG